MESSESAQTLKSPPFDAEHQPRRRTVPMLLWGAGLARPRGSGHQGARGRARAHWSITVVPPLLLGVAVLIAWEVLVRSGSVSSFLLPAPAAVARSFWSALTHGILWQYGRTTLAESLTGFILGSLIGLPSGYAVAHSRLIARTLEPYLAASQAMPAIALAPLLVLWLGYGTASVAALCALIVFFPVHINAVLGLRTLDREVLDAARVDGAGAWSLLRDFEIPLALPSILTGMRAGLTLSITGAVVGEFVIGDRGLGGLLTIARGNFDTPLVFATLATLALLAAGFYRFGLLVERWLSYLEE